MAWAVLDVQVWLIILKKLPELRKHPLGVPEIGPEGLLQGVRAPRGRGEDDAEIRRSEGGGGDGRGGRGIEACLVGQDGQRSHVAAEGPGHIPGIGALGHGSRDMAVVGRRPKAEPIPYIDDGGPAAEQPFVHLLGSQAVGRSHADSGDDDAMEAHSRLLRRIRCSTRQADTRAPKIPGATMLCPAR